MCQMLKKSLFTLVLLSFCVFPVLSEEDSSDLQEFQKIALELNKQSSNSTIKSSNSSQNSTSESKNANNSVQTLNQHELESMSVYSLLDQLDLQLTSLQLQVETLKTSSKNLETELTCTKNELMNSKLLCQQLKTALISNKDDAGVIIKEIGELTEKVKSLNEYVDKMKKRIKFAPLGAGILGIGCTTGSFILSQGLDFDDNSYNKDAAIIGGSIVFGSVLIWTLGEYVFQVW